MFGAPAKVGLENTIINLSSELLPQMTQEDEVSGALEEMQDTPCTPTEDDSTSCTAKRMKRDFDAKFPEVDVGASVRVPVPDVDRGKTDAR